MLCIHYIYVACILMYTYTHTCVYRYIRMAVELASAIDHLHNHVHPDCVVIHRGIHYTCIYKCGCIYMHVWRMRTIYFTVYMSYTLYFTIVCIHVYIVSTVNVYDTSPILHILCYSTHICCIQILSPTT